MTVRYVDATTLIALGTIGELSALEAVSHPPVLLPTVAAEVTTEPARTNVTQARERGLLRAPPAIEYADERAQTILGEDDHTGDVQLIGAVLAHTAAGDDVAVISDDRRVRTVARGLDAAVTGTIGVVGAAVDDGQYTGAQAKQVVRQLDAHGLHMTATLRERAVELIERAAEDR